MTIDEAIEISTNERKEHHSFPTDIIGQAAQLGIEALKRLKVFRVYDAYGHRVLLPGETEDYCKFCGIAHAGIECPSRAGEK